MTIKVARIDERLIHGQVAYSWSVAYQITQIIVIDDDAANDPTQTMLLEMAVPEGKKHKILTNQQAVDVLTKEEKSENIFLVVKSPDTYLYLVNQGIKIPSINVGGMYYQPNKKKVSNTVYLNKHDKKVFSELINKGVHCEIRTSPNDKSLDIAKVIN